MTIRNRTKTFLILAAVAMVGAGATSTTHAAQVLVNFGDTAYTTDGANTWQTFDLDTPGPLNNVATTALVDTDNNASGISLNVTSVDVGSFEFMASSAGATETVFNSASGNSGWFDSSVAAQRETSRFFSYDITFTFSGFSASDIVTFDFAVGGASNNEPQNRTINLSRVGGATLLSNALTAGTAHFSTDSGLTGETSYSFLVEGSGSTSSMASINALQIDIVPEPATFGSLAMLGGLALAGFRRRRSR